MRFLGLQVFPALEVKGVPFPSLKYLSTSSRVLDRREEGEPIQLLTVGGWRRLERFGFLAPQPEPLPLLTIRSVDPANTYWTTLYESLLMGIVMGRVASIPLLASWLANSIN